MPSPASSGGFFHQTILSPAPSTTSSVATSTLPRPRTHPLKPGCPKESSFINYVDREILKVQRRYAKKFGETVPATASEAPSANSVNGSASVEDGLGEDVENVKGYKSFREAGRDIERVIDIVWVSGTPSLQIPYLLSLALLVASYIPAFPASPKTMFRVLDKLDLAFAGLLQGRDLESGDALPGLGGFGGGRAVSGTKRVRIKSLVESTRVGVVELMSGGDREDEMVEDDDADGQSDELGDDNGLVDEDVDVDMDEEGTWAMQIAKVYDRTIVELGDTIGGTPIGIPPI